MTLQLGEGQAFTADYSLISRLHRRERAENWVALDQASGERVVLKIFDGSLPVSARERVEAAVVATRGLVHPNIARVYGIDAFEGNDYIVCQYVRGGTPLAPSLSAGDEMARRWPIVEQLIDAISFAHGLSLAHGHLHPGNILTDDQGRLSITDFGLPPSLQDDASFIEWLSPQVRDGAVADASDDIFSLGQLLAVMLTGQPWREDMPFESTRPVPPELRQLVTRMLSNTAYERPKDTSVIKDTVRRFMLGDTEAPLEALGEFRRPDAAPAGAASQAASTADVHRLPRERQVISTPLALGGFALLMVMAVVVFFLLPAGGPDTATSTQNTSPQTTAQPEAPGQSPQSAPARTTAESNELPVLTPLERARIEQMEERGAELGRELLRLQVQLEDAGVQIWAQERFNAAVDKTADADETYRNDDFEQALALYEQAKAEFEALISDMDRVREENVLAGNEAIDAGDPDAAIRAFTIVTAIDPEDETASRRLELAENLEILLDRLDEAEYLEQERQLDEAQELLRSALALESGWRPAADALSRVEQKIAQRRFNDAMSAALTALDSQDFDTARQRFEEAGEILPGSSEPADGLQQVEIAEQQQQIATLRQQAEAHEANEQWQQAIDTYRDILGIDGTLVFANDGLARSERRLELDQRVSRFVEQPTLMQSDDELQAARSALAEAARIRDNNDDLKEKLNRLSYHIALARIPVEVEIRSDNRTEVIVYRYGELGRIDSTSIELIPGQYTIVGKRRGYRDAEHTLTLTGGRDVDPIYIACTEEI